MCIRDSFYLVVRGDSMEPRIQDGALALVHKQDTLCLLYTSRCV